MHWHLLEIIPYDVTNTWGLKKLQKKVGTGIRSHRAPIKAMEASLLVSTLEFFLSNLWTICNKTRKIHCFGVIVDRQFKFSTNAKFISLSPLQSVGTIKRAMSSRQTSVFTKFYKVLVCPHLEIGILLASSSFNKGKEILNKLQRSAAKTVESHTKSVYVT